ncbi:MAG: type II secretion system protein, partial [Candidatus Omnitrophota bacterium]
MSRKSFTIIEILVIISVLSILIGLAIPRVKGMMDSANIAKIKGELQTLQAAIESYYTFKHTIPGTPISFMSVDTALVATWLSTTSPLVISTPLVDPYGVASAEYVY